ncbi:MAG TPA: hypothetical protein VFY02_05770 [Gaiellaceae bacterium]|nr:hypothetical protein [Gaiellaceae bacterium]
MDNATGSDRKRLATAFALVTGIVALFVTLGGVGVAQSAVGAAHGQYGKKATVCHKGKKTISIGKAAVAAHLRHGDTVGTCASARAKAAKAKAAKAAKAKKAKKAKAAKAAKAEKAKAAKAGKPAHAGRPDHAGKPEHAGKPADTGKTDNGKSTPGRGKGK